MTAGVVAMFLCVCHVRPLLPPLLCNRNPLAAAAVVATVAAVNAVVIVSGAEGQVSHARLVMRHTRLY